MYFLMPERTLKVAKTLNDTPKKEGLKYKYSMMQNTELFNQVPYFLDYKTHFPPKIWEENGGVSYSPNIAYLAGGRGRGMEWGFSFLFSSSKTQVCLMVRCILQSEKYGNSIFSWLQLSWNWLYEIKDEMIIELKSVEQRSVSYIQPTGQTCTTACYMACDIKSFYMLKCFSKKIKRIIILCDM